MILGFSFVSSIWNISLVLWFSNIAWIQNLVFLDIFELRNLIEFCECLISRVRRSCGPVVSSIVYTGDWSVRYIPQLGQSCSIIYAGYWNVWYGVQLGQSFKQCWSVVSTQFWLASRWRNKDEVWRLWDSNRDSLNYIYFSQGLAPTLYKLGKFRAGISRLMALLFWFQGKHLLERYLKGF